MFFVEIINPVSANIPLMRSYNNMIFKDLFLSHKSVSFFYSSNTSSCYLICIEHNDLLITYIYMLIAIICNQYISIDYIRGINSTVVTEFVNPGLLIISMYALFCIKSISILILEVNACNLSAFSLYYWFGFQLIRRREHYYNINYFCNVFNTAYILMNTKSACKNTFRRYFL